MLVQSNQSCEESGHSILTQRRQRQIDHHFASWVFQSNWRTLRNWALPACRWPSTCNSTNVCVIWYDKGVSVVWIDTNPNRFFTLHIFFRMTLPFKANFPGVSSTDISHPCSGTVSSNIAKKGAEFISQFVMFIYRWFLLFALIFWMW